MQPACLTVETYAERDLCTRGFFCNVLRTSQGPVTLINGGHFPQANLSVAHRGTRGRWEVTPPSVFEALMFLHDLTLVNSATHDKALNCSRLYTTGTLIDYAVQRSTTNCSALAQAAKWPQFDKLVAPYILFDSEKRVPRLGKAEPWLFAY